MKKVFKFFVPAALIVLTAGCMGDLQYEDPVDAPVTRRYTLSFDVPTKTLLGDDNRSVSWAPNDQIYYYTKKDSYALGQTSVSVNGNYGFIDLTLGRVDGYLNALFCGAANSSTASIPLYLDTVAEEGRKYSFCAENVVLDEQCFHSFAEVHSCAAHLDNVNHTNILFRSIVSVFKFNLDSLGVKKIVFSPRIDQKVINGGYYGTVKVSFNQDGSGALDSVVADDPEGNLTGCITINTDGTGEYYFSIIPSYFPNGFLLQCYDESNQLVKNVEYKKPLVAGVKADGSLYPTVIGLKNYTDWKTTQEPAVVHYINGVEVEPSSLDFLIGDGPTDVTITVSGDDDEADKTVSWDLSGDQGVVNVEQLSVSGGVTTLRVTPLAIGNATITVTSVGKASDDQSIVKTILITVSEPDPDLPTDLSADKGPANCYIVNEFSGEYMFPTVKGNSSESVGSVASVGVLWETRCMFTNNTFISAKSIIDDVKLSGDGSYITFTSQGFGSALIAALDANNDILWSWHIWVWPSPGFDETVNFNTYKNNAGYLMDRDLGADNSYPSTAAQDKSAYGLLYQWGRKDPFFGGDKRSVVGDIPEPVSNDEYVDGVRVGTVQYATAHPNVYILYSEDHQDWIHGSVRNSSLWGTTKTIYDPCPPGWKVPVASVWTTAMGTTINNTYGLQDNSHNGINFTGIMSDDPIVLYSASGGMRGTRLYSYYSSTGDIYGATQYGYWWSSGVKGTAGHLLVMLNDSKQANPNSQAPRSHAYSVRCMWDSATSPQGVQPQVIPVSTLTVEPDNSVLDLDENKNLQLTITVEPSNASNSAYRCESSNESVATVSSSGYVTAVGSGTATITVTSIANPTIFDTCVITVGDPTQGGLVDLSENGSANSYVVSFPAQYKFKLVKGNTNTKVAASSVQWLWQSDGTGTAPSGVIQDLAIDGDYAVFTVPTEMKNGNVLIAALDDNSNVLWSWHIWACIGYDPEQYQQTYYDGSVVMDRNLGALSATPGNVQAFGLMYQWGRKDPFLAAYNPESMTGVQAASRKSGLQNWDIILNTQVSNPLDYSILYPMHFLTSKGHEDWMTSSNGSLWSGTSKTMYDPCPPGWMMPVGGSNSLWANAFNAGNKDGSKTQNVNKDARNYGFRYTNIFMEGTIWFPCTGLLWGHTGTTEQTVGNYLKLWSGTYYYNSTYHMSYMLSQEGGSFYWNGSTPRSNGLPVRCVKQN